MLIKCPNTLVIIILVDAYCIICMAIGYEQNLRIMEVALLLALCVSKLTLTFIPQLNKQYYYVVAGTNGEETQVAMQTLALGLLSACLFYNNNISCSKRQGDFVL